MNCPLNEKFLKHHKSYFFQDYRLNSKYTRAYFYFWILTLISFYFKLPRYYMSLLGYLKAIFKLLRD